MAITKGEILDHLDSVDTHDRESLEIYIAECEEFYQMESSLTHLQPYKGIIE